ncbi:aldehyde dehydrogenase family protein [Paraburkholderia guartelaensis]|uniref:Aldehyde dehydrogenase family protein n=1 Tax=Paraburkholderia guartelaensis TaxID=2546446 RepID=A0ABU9SI79_9BURK
MALSQSHRRPLDVPGRLYIGGAFVEADGAASVEHVNPSTGRPQAVVPLGSVSDIDRAVRAARVSQRVWMEMGPRARARSFRRLEEAGPTNRLAVRIHASKCSLAPCLFQFIRAARFIHNLERYSKMYV